MIIKDKSIITFALIVLMLSCLVGCTKEDTHTANQHRLEDSIEGKDNPLSVPKTLSQFPFTELMPTLENPISNQKNSIYAACLLLAWEHYLETLQDSIQLHKDNSQDFFRINQSKTYQNVLHKNEYEVKIQQADGTEIYASFYKSLPFFASFDTLSEGIDFGKSKVKAFGLSKYNPQIAQNIFIHSYTNEHQFVISLKSAASQDEIFLAKGIPLRGNSWDILQQMKKEIAKAQPHSQVPCDIEYPHFLPDDYLAIPAIDFHILHSYPTLNNQSFNTHKGNVHKILSNTQEIAFCMDKNGISTLNNVQITVDSSAKSCNTLKRKFIFDAPFFLVLKRKDNPNPYLTLIVRNSEIMKKTKSSE